MYTRVRPRRRVLNESRGPPVGCSLPAPNYTVLYQGWYLEETVRWSGSEHDVRVGGIPALMRTVKISSRKQAALAEISFGFSQ